MNVAERTDGAAPAAVRAARIAYADLGASALLAAYVAGDPRALALYPADPYAPGALAAAADRAAAYPRDRDALADVLREQNTAWGASEEVLAAIERLRDVGAVAVVTGQQLGLFGGPLYTLHKALSAVRLAEKVEQETGRPAVPVFWLADEDHDYAEIHTAQFARGEAVTRVVYSDGRAPEENRGPVGRVVLGDAVTDTLEALEASLPAGPFREGLLEGLRQAWAPGTLWRDSFAATLRLLLPDTPLVLFSADDPRVKRLAAPVLGMEAAGWAETHAAHEAQSARVAAAGFGVQVPPRPLHLFLLGDDGGRHALDVGDDGAAVTVRGSGHVLGTDELAALAREAPERLSPDVVLRPVIQDALFPTAAYVAGPGEAAYFAQLTGVYARFGVPMPVIYPRASITLVEPAVRRTLERYGLPLLDLRGDPARLHARLALEREGSSLEAALAEADVAVEAAVARVSGAATALDPSLDRAADAARAYVEKALARLRLKTVRVAKRRQAEVGAQVARAHAALFPGGAPQERALSALGLWARYGPHLARFIADGLDLDTRAHEVFDLP
ncbi:MAG TPA: bacillithiol biosynthesis cysteine-adding enzyme BshC [Rhodothermales bacterium]|nr:bacillithiol biosynthesis cysteine-adding enzyme BshC [Rhodothermales bacterium]